MQITNQQFDDLVNEAIENLPEKMKERMYNVAILTDDFPTKDQQKKSRYNKNIELLGLFEGYAQSSRHNFGAVLPDRITLFRKSIIKRTENIEELKEQIRSTLVHEIAHHFGLDEEGARRVSKK